MTVVQDTPTSIVPGVYDISADQYHQDPIPGGSLSSTGARKLLPPSCPAKFRYELGHPQAPKREFDLGTAVHTELFGVGTEMTATDYDTWRTKAAQAEATEIRASGGVPLLAHEGEQVRAMVDALGQHPEAAALLDPAGGEAEQSLFWQDDATGVWLRARLDWLRHDGQIVDFKTCRAADLDSIQKGIQEHRYYMQDAWYRDGVRALGISERPEFTFVFQEKQPPYLVTVVHLDDEWLRLGVVRNRAAIATYAWCRDTDQWPGYADQAVCISQPTYASRRDSEEYS